MKPKVGDTSMNMSTYHPAQKTQPGLAAPMSPTQPTAQSTRPTLFVVGDRVDLIDSGYRGTVDSVKVLPSFVYYEIKIDNYDLQTFEFSACEIRLASTLPPARTVDFKPGDIVLVDTQLGSIVGEVYWVHIQMRPSYGIIYGINNCIGPNCEDLAGMYHATDIHFYAGYGQTPTVVPNEDEYPGYTLPDNTQTLAEYRKEQGLCPICGVKGHFSHLVFVCPVHGEY